MFEEEIHETITKNKLFVPGDTVAIGASGGKDSTVLAHIMKVLNERHNYGLNLILLSIDEGITGYRDDSLETVKRNKDQYELPLQSPLVRRTVWMDDGCYCEEYWKKE